MSDQQQKPAEGNTDASQVKPEAGKQESPQPKADAKAAAAAEQKPVDKKPDPQAAKPAAKPDAQAKTEDKPADKIELALPEGSKLNAADVDRIASFAKDHGLSKDAAQALLERESASAAERESASLEQLQAQSDAWKQEIIADKDFGGDKAAETAQLAHDVAKRFGDDGFVDELERTGLGNHPGFVRMLARVGRAMSPDTLKGGGTPPARKMSTEEKLYGAQT